MYLAMLTLPLLGSIFPGFFARKVGVTLFILGFFYKLVNLYVYICQVIITTAYNEPFIIIFILLQLLLLLLFFTIFVKNIWFKKLAIFIIYVYYLCIFIDSCISNNITGIFSISIIIVSSIFSVLIIYNNLYYKKSKMPKLSLKELFTKFYFLPKEYKKLIIPTFLIALVITRLSRYLLLDLLGLSYISLTSYLFIIFSLIAPSIIFFRIVHAVILHINFSHGNINILSVTFKELFNVSHYDLNNIDLKIILTILSLGFFSIASIELIYFQLYGFNNSIQVYENIQSKTCDPDWHIICSSNNTTLPIKDPSVSPTPTNSSLHFASPSPPPFRTFEQKLWINKGKTLGDAKSLDVAKRILLHKICLSRNIPNDVQMVIQDNIWGNHWYELYTNEYGHDEYGNIVHNSILYDVPSSQYKFYKDINTNIFPH